MSHDPAEDLAAIAGPVLAITGLADLQVDPADVQAIGRLVTGPFTGETPEDLTHLLRFDHHAPSLRRYPALLRNPVAPSVIDRVRVVDDHSAVLTPCHPLAVARVPCDAFVAWSQVSARPAH